MPLVRIYANLSLCFSFIEHFVCVRERKREREREPLVPIGSWLFCASAPALPRSLDCRVADRLTAIHFAGSHVRLAYGSRSHAGSRYWRGRFIQFLLMRRTFPGSHPLGCLINVLLHTFFARIRGAALAHGYKLLHDCVTSNERIFLIAGGRRRPQRRFQKNARSIQTFLALSVI